MSKTVKWCLDNHRLKIFDRQVFLVDEYGTKWWYLNGKYHRVNGPAIEWANGSTEWYFNDRRHRVNGPAIEYVNGDKYWYLYNKEYSESAYWKELRK